MVMGERMSLSEGGSGKACLDKKDLFGLMITLSMPIQVSMIPFTGKMEILPSVRLEVLYVYSSTCGIGKILNRLPTT